MQVGIVFLLLKDKILNRGDSMAAKRDTFNKFTGMCIIKANTISKYSIMTK